MAAMTDTHVWHVPVPAAVAALSSEDAVALVLGSTFARRMAETDPEHSKRLCPHGRLLFQRCGFCEAGVPAMPHPTHDECRAFAARWLP